MGNLAAERPQNSTRPMGAAQGAPLRPQAVARLSQAERLSRSISPATAELVATLSRVEDPSSGDVDVAQGLNRWSDERLRAHWNELTSALLESAEEAELYRQGWLTLCALTGLVADREALNDILAQLPPRLLEELNPQTKTTAAAPAMAEAPAMADDPAMADVPTMVDAPMMAAAPMMAPAPSSAAPAAGLLHADVMAVGSDAEAVGDVVQALRSKLADGHMLTDHELAQIEAAAEAEDLALDTAEGATSGSARVEALRAKLAEGHMLTADELAELEANADDEEIAPATAETPAVAPKPATPKKEKPVDKSKEKAKVVEKKAAGAKKEKGAAAAKKDKLNKGKADPPSAAPLTAPAAAPGPAASSSADDASIEMVGASASELLGHAATSWLESAADPPASAVDAAPAAAARVELASTEELVEALRAKLADGHMLTELELAQMEAAEDATDAVEGATSASARVMALRAKLAEGHMLTADELAELEASAGNAAKGGTATGGKAAAGGGRARSRSPAVGTKSGGGKSADTVKVGNRFRKSEGAAASGEAVAAEKVVGGNRFRQRRPSDPEPEAVAMAVHAVDGKGRGGRSAAAAPKQAKEGKSKEKVRSPSPPKAAASSKGGKEKGAGAAAAILFEKTSSSVPAKPSATGGAKPMAASAGDADRNLALAVDVRVLTSQLRDCGDAEAELRVLRAEVRRLEEASTREAAVPSAPPPPTRPPE